MATNGVQLRAPVHLDVAAFRGDEGGGELVVERAGHMGWNPPLEDRHAVSGGHPGGRAGGGLMIGMPGDAARLEYHEQIGLAEPLFDLRVERVKRDVGQAAVGIVQ